MSGPPSDVITQDFDIGGAGGFRGDLDPEYLIRLQINRCAIAQTTGNEAMHMGAVLALITQLPTKKRKEIEAEAGDYTYTEDEYEYRTINGWKIGTPEYPVYTNLPGDDDYNPRLKQVEKVKETVKRKVLKFNEEKGEDEEVEEEYEVEKEVITYGKPVLVSPKLVKKEHIDPSKLNIKAMEKLQGSGLTWKMEKIEVFTGELWDPSMAEKEDKVEPATVPGA